MYFEIFQGVNKKWFWRLCSVEEQKFAFSSRGYDSQQDTLNAINIIRENIQEAHIEEFEIKKF